MFDGVHLGHQQVIRQAVADAEQHEGVAVAVTFDQHPNTIVAPDRVPPLIYSLPQKLRAIGALGVDATLLIHFDREFSLQSGEAFVRHLARALSPLHSVCVGSNFTFGHKRGGNVELLKKLGAELNFGVHGLAAGRAGWRSCQQHTASRNNSRRQLRRGEPNARTRIRAVRDVVRGDQLGQKAWVPDRRISTPTGLVLPPSGVYAVHAYVSGQRHRGVANIGHRPTLQNPEPQLRIEAHLLDFSGDLYGAEMELTFVDKLRDERRFSSLDHLRAQIVADIERARALF
jgi:riboflavin kinase/FMN adenylyltransferase